MDCGTRLTICLERVIGTLWKEENKMLTLLFAIMMIGVFGRLAGIAFRMSWGLVRGLFSLIFLPGIIIAGFAMGLLRLAFPLLAVIGLVSLLAPRRAVSRGTGGPYYYYDQQ